MSSDVFPDRDTDLPHLEKKLAGSVFIAQVRPSVALRKNGNAYLLVKDESILLGVAIIDDNVKVANKLYSSLVVIYVPPKYRKTSATHWLVFSVKEELRRPLLVDGAIFKGGGELILSLMKHQSIRGSVLDKETGEITPLVGLVDDPNKAYVFEQTNLGYAKDYFESGSPVWLPVFEAVDTI
jgi:hypothetical protein